MPSSCFEIDVTVPPAAKILFVAGAVLVDADGRLLICQRPPGKAFAGLWEFPGGKMEAGETPEATLVRELNEELGILTKPSCFSPLTFASHHYADMGLHVVMPLFVCRVWQGVASAREGQKLAWVEPGALYSYSFVAADVPLLPLVRQLL